MKHLFLIMLCFFVLLKGILPSSLSSFWTTYLPAFSSDSTKVDSTLISFIGNGEIQKAVSSGSEIPANTGMGFIFDRIYPNSGTVKLFRSVHMNGYLNIVSTLDTLKAFIVNDTFVNLTDFGNYLLIPTNAKHAAKVYFKGYFYKNPSKCFQRSTYLGDIKDVIDGMHVSVSASNRVLEIDNFNINASVFSIRMGVFHEFIPVSMQSNNDYSLILGMDLSQRILLGDIGQQKNKEFRSKYLQTTRRLFIGGEYYLTFRFKNIVAEVSAVGLYPKRGEDFPGLTITRMVTSIKFVGGFPLLLK